MAEYDVLQVPANVTRFDPRFDPAYSNSRLLKQHLPMPSGS